MRKLTSLMTGLLLAACQTTGQPQKSEQSDQVVVTGSRITTSAKTCWDGSSTTIGACPPKPVKVMGWDGSITYQSAPAPSDAKTPQALSAPTKQALAGGYELETIPPVIETQQRNVVSQPATAIERVVPAIIGDDGVVIQEATTEIMAVPPTMRTVTEQVVIVPQKFILRNPEGRIVREFNDADEFAQFQNNPYKRTADEPVSTFSADVDTASYSFARQAISGGRLPPKDSIRIEEMINYFDYDYPKPNNKSKPFKPTLSIVPSPWNNETKLIQIGIQGYEAPAGKRPDMNLVFLVDVSGSMGAKNKLDLLKRSFEPLLKNLTKDDTVSIVTYASRENVALKPTPGHKRADILEVINSLQASGSTAGEAGIQMAYEQAEKAFKRKGTNRIILATDGDFNVGISDPKELEDFVATKRKSNIYLSVLGFGQGNLKDNRMQALAQNGNGIAAYIDSLREARKFFDTDMSKNLNPIADDLKIQVEFNPDRVSEYRLIGYETRALKREDFNNDKVDAGDIGSGHRVTAIYEINPTGAKNLFVDPLRYGANTKPTASNDFANEYGFVKIRYKRPGSDTSSFISEPLMADFESKALRHAPVATRFATAVAAYGLKLRGDIYMQDLEWETIANLAASAKGVDPYGYRAEFVELARDAALAK